MTKPAKGPAVVPHAELFRRGADVGARGVGPTRDAAFDQAALALKQWRGRQVVDELRARHHHQEPVDAGRRQRGARCLQGQHGRRRGGASRGPLVQSRHARARYLHQGLRRGRGT